MKKKIYDIVFAAQYEGLSTKEATDQLFGLGGVSNSALIDYIENDAEIAMPIDEMFNEDGAHITKKKYGHMLLKYLVKELRRIISNGTAV